MEAIETAKTVLSEMVEAAGEIGVTEGQAAGELIKHGIGYHEAVDFLKNVYKEIGAERTEPHTGKVICYRKPKKEPEQQETAAMKMAKKAAQSNENERRTAEIIGSYRK